MSWFKRLFTKRTTSVFGGSSATAVTRDSYVKAQEGSSEPWASFEVGGFEPDSGRVKVQFAWNQAFIDELTKLGFVAETQEDTVQMFFYAAQMKPTTLADVGGDETVQPTDLPNLSPNTNRIVE